MTFMSLSAALADFFDAPLTDVPEDVRRRIDEDFWPMPWGELEPEQRRTVAKQWDMQHDPAYAEVNARAWELVCELDDAKATAERLRAAVARATGLEREANIRQAAETAAEIARIEGELAAEQTAQRAAGPARKDKEWAVIAREIADRLHERDVAAGAHDSIVNMAERVAAEMRARDIHGPRGPVSGSTVKREALQGGKWVRKSTPISMGKRGKTGNP